MSNHATPLQSTLHKLQAVFPEAVTETRREDAKGRPYTEYALKEEFVAQLRDAGLDLADAENRYELQFPGKAQAKAQALLPAYKTLLPAPGQSVDFESTGNVFLEGDNLDALRMLQQSYRGRVKMIYIDPPYNTGGDDFVYNDDFSLAQRAYLQKAGMLDEEGARQVSEVQTGLHGRFHAGWLAMMYPRLKLARELLRDDGAIFISIDDNEQANLKLLCDEIFGEENFVSMLIWRKKAGGGQDSEYFAIEHEYVLCYRKSEKFVMNFRTTEVNPKDFNKTKNGRKCYYIKLEKWGSNAYQSDRPTMHYAIKDPDGHDFFPQAPDGKPGNWRTRPLALDEEHIHWEKRKGRWTPLEVKYFDETSGSKIVKERTILYDLATTTEGTVEQKILFNVPVFNNPKPINLLTRLLRVGNGSDDIILDFFAGSGTTAHAVMQLNAEDGGKRRFIMVQWPEKIDAKKSKDAHQFCTQELQRPATIAEISKERIRRAGKKVRDENPLWKGDTGFRVFTIADSLLNTGEQSPPLAQMEQSELSGYKTQLPRENFQPLLYETLLHTGVALDLPIAVHEVANYPFALCDGRCYCVTENLTQEIARQITEQHGAKFDVLYYLSDAPAATTSFTELEAAVRLAPGEKQIQALNFY